MKFTEEDLWETIQTLGGNLWMTSILRLVAPQFMMIDGAGTKWAPVKGTRKYNKDAFIVIKNRSRDEFVPSQGTQ